MANANFFGGFVHTNPLTSHRHDPLIALASNCVRDFFGPTVQMVADCLQLRGSASSLTEIVATIRQKCREKVWSKERIRLLGHERRPSIETPPIRAALLVLIQHSIVTVELSLSSNFKNRNSKRPATTIFRYRYHPNRAHLLPRYPRFVEYTRKALDETAAALIEEILVLGRVRTVDAVVRTVEYLQRVKDAPKSEKYTLRQSLLESFKRLVESGFIERVSPLPLDLKDDEEAEFDEPPKKRVKIEESAIQASTAAARAVNEDPAVVALLQENGSYRQVLPQDAVWRVNVNMFHDSLRAFCLGRLVAERFGHVVQSAGSMVSAALKFAAYQQHAVESKHTDEDGVNETFGSYYFGAEDIQKYLPKPVQQTLEKKPGGILLNLSRSLVTLANLKNPVVLQRQEGTDSGNQGSGKFKVATRALVNFLQERVLHQVILDSHGEVAARICSILRGHGYLESDAIAAACMVPAKDTREYLHSLYRSNYVDLFNLHQSRQHNPANMIYLWSISKGRILRTVINNVTTALLHLRLRRQHEVEVGKEWIERAKEAGVTDENENEADKVNYAKFCQGLERLDCALLQLDETLMVLKDF